MRSAGLGAKVMPKCGPEWPRAHWPSAHLGARERLAVDPEAGGAGLFQASLPGGSQLIALYPPQDKLLFLKLY